MCGWMTQHYHVTQCKVTSAWTALAPERPDCRSYSLDRAERNGGWLAQTRWHAMLSSWLSNCF